MQKEKQKICYTTGIKEMGKGKTYKNMKRYLVITKMIGMGFLCFPASE